VNIHDVTILNCYHGMKLDSLWKPRFQNITIRHCWRGIETWGGREVPDPNDPRRLIKLGCELRLTNANIEVVHDFGIYAWDTAGGIILTHVEIGWVGKVGVFLKHLSWAHLTAVLVDWFVTPEGNENPNGTGYAFDDVIGVQMSNCWAGSTGGYGMQILNSKQMLINGMQFRPACKYGIYVKGVAGKGCEEITISSCQLSDASEVAIWLDDEVRFSKVIGNSVSHCRNGIKETGNCRLNEIAHNQILYFSDEPITLRAGGLTREVDNWAWS
jgi:hypothetical protein